MARKFTARQLNFIREYLIDLNAKQAAIRAGYAETHAAIQAHQQLSDPDIRSAIDEHLEARARRTLISADMVLTELYQIATCDISEAFDENGDLKPLGKIPVAVRKAISSVEIDALYDMENHIGGRRKIKIGEVKRIKFWDKPKTLETLAKHLKLLTERIELGGPGGTPLIKHAPVINYISIPVTVQANGAAETNGHAENGRMPHV